MEIAYIDPLSRAWNRMKQALFKPFDIKKWFVVGFTAFLAGLTEGPHGNGSGNGGRGGHGNADDFFSFPRIAWEWLMDHPVWFSLIVFGLFLLIAWIILITWLSSRGKFMFLHNVVHDVAQVAKPWRDLKKQGNSLFLWRLCFGFIIMALVIFFLVVGFLIAANIYYGNYPGPVAFLLILGTASLAFVSIVISAYISLFLNDFVVPIMYKNNIKTNQAWKHFLPLFGKHWIHFILYGLFILGLSIIVFICVLLAILFTCCIALLIIIIPYIGSVALLPISYTFRALSLEFLGQFGPEFTLFPVAGNPTGADL